MLIKKIREFNNGLAGMYTKNLPFKVAYAVQKNRSNISMAIELASKKQEQELYMHMHFIFEMLKKQMNLKLTV